jgi:hypothetical protein
LPSSDRTLDFVQTVNQLRADVARLEALGAARWGSVNPNTAWGRVASVSATSNQTGITSTPTDTFATASWTGVAGRLYRITLTARLVQVTSTGSQVVDILTGASGAGTLLNRNTDFSISAGFAGIGTLVAFHTGTGALSAHVQASTSAGTITVDNVNQKGWFVVEDAGPT